MKLNGLRVLFAVGVVSLLVAYAYAKNKTPSLVTNNNSMVSPSPTPSESTPTTEDYKVENVSGEITSTEQSQKGITLLKVKLSNSETPLSVDANDKTIVTDESGNKILPIELQEGFTIAVSGVPAVGVLRATEIKVIKSPNIVVFSPEDNETVGKLFKVSGIGRVFENRMSLTIRNKRNNELYQDAPVTTDAKDTGKYGPFLVNVDLSKVTDLKDGDVLLLEAFQYSPKDSEQIDTVKRTLMYKQ